MGVDISWQVERRRRDDGGWERAEPLVPRAVPRSTGPTDVRWEAYGRRDRWLFGLLRGEHAAAGFPLPRGLPADVSTEVLLEHQDSGAHGTSWLSIRELLAHDWGRLVEDEAEVHDDYGDGRPGQAEAIEAVSRQQLRLARGFFAQPILVGPGDRRGDGARITWEESVLQGRDELAHCLVLMAGWARGDLDSVRAVFWFDG